MDYEPHDHRSTGKEVVVAWVVCLGIAGLGLGMTAQGRAVATAAVAPTVVSAPEPCAMTGARIPTFALCRTDQASSRTASATANRGPAPLPLTTRCS
jgi:hypothetical protein